MGGCGIILETAVCGSNIYVMKRTVRLRMDKKLLASSKAYAASNGTSVCELVVGFLKTLPEPTKGEDVVDVVEKLDRPDLDTGGDLRDGYYEDRSGKYGF